MPKKYIQLLLSINFCLTAVATATGSGAGTSTMPLEESFMQDAKYQFDQIWSCLEEINAIYQYQPLQEFIWRKKNQEISFDKDLEISQKEFLKEYLKFSKSMHSYRNLPDPNLEEKINSCLSNLTNYFSFIHKKNSPQKKEKFFLISQFKKFEDIPILPDNSIKTSILAESEDSSKNDAPESDDEPFIHLAKRAVASESISPISNVNEDTVDDSSAKIELKTLFDHIWRHLEKINEIYPIESLQILISEHKQPEEKHEVLSEEELAEDLEYFFSSLNEDVRSISKSRFIEKLDESRKQIIKTQFEEILELLKVLNNKYKNPQTLSKDTQVFLTDQLAELYVFFQHFLTEDLNPSEDNLESNDIAELGEESSLHLVKRDTDLSNSFSDEFSPIRIDLDNQFNQIWECLNKINSIHRSELQQSLRPDHRVGEIPYNENLEISQEVLKNQFIQLFKELKVCSQYHPKALDVEDKVKLDVEFNQITRCLGAIYETFESESLSKKEKAFLSDQLKDLHNFSHNFITENSLQLHDNFVTQPPLQTDEVELNPLDRIQALLNSCEGEDSLIYPQYEYIINGHEANISRLLKSSKEETPIENRFIYFNKDEGLIEIEHTELSEDREHIESYTTTWKIRPADINAVTGWQTPNLISVDKTPFYSKYTMRGEKLDYTLTDVINNKSVRANFVCKSSNENTYTILSIDYLESIVVLKNGPCLFVQGEDLKEWHASDTVVLQRRGSVTDTNNSHELINKTRGSQHVWVFLKRK